MNIKLKYKYDSNYSPKYVSGVHGAVTAQKQIIMDFFYERYPIPHHTIHKLKPDGHIGDLTEQEPPINPNVVDILRFIETGIVIDLSFAKELQKWLYERIKEAESL